ncbi:hypothetical protein EVAR_63889_1 [Eumeta japonica]|uniref:Uncharacterized protein n=1 Tax=Eumeta variegata TaxID=151549 RepID=A0A4C1ZFT0_EUMVA|nr:hypothetical protein EVAR_63889_1 [Eumeta japonica]
MQDFLCAGAAAIITPPVRRDGQASVVYPFTELACRNTRHKSRRNTIYEVYIAYIASPCAGDVLVSPIIDDP